MPARIRPLVVCLLAAGPFLPAGGALASPVPLVADREHPKPGLPEGVYVTSDGFGTFVGVTIQGGAKRRLHEGKVWPKGRIVGVNRDGGGLAASDVVKVSGDGKCLDYAIDVPRKAFRQFFFKVDSPDARFELREVFVEVFVGRNRVNPTSFPFEVTGLPAPRPKEPARPAPLAKPAPPPPPKPLPPTGPRYRDQPPGADIECRKYVDAYITDGAAKVWNGSPWTLKVKVTVTRAYPGMGMRTADFDHELEVPAGAAGWVRSDSPPPSTYYDRDYDGQLKKFRAEPSVYEYVFKSVRLQRCTVR